MLRRFHDRFGTPGVVIAVIALIVALGGTALAAGGLTAKQKKEVKTIAKSFQGTGPQGPQGLPGAPGANGKDGAPGKDGTNGTNGTNGVAGTNGVDGQDGESVTVNSYAGSECATEEGAEFTNGTGTAYACSGPEGPPGPVTGVAQSGVSMSGMVTFPTTAAAGEITQIKAVMAFPYRLPGGQGEAFNIISNEEGYAKKVVPFPESFTAGSVEGCPGKYTEPRAETKTLCIYEFVFPGLETSVSPFSASDSGIGVYTTLEGEAESGEGTITWAYRVP